MNFTPFTFRALPLKINWRKRILEYSQYDGDSMWTLFDKGSHQYDTANCRFFGINTPERNDPDPAVREQANHARMFLRGLMGGPQPCENHVWVESKNKVAKFCSECGEYERTEKDPMRELFVTSAKLDKYGRPVTLYWTDKGDFGDPKKSVNYQMIAAGFATPYLDEGMFS